MWDLFKEAVRNLEESKVSDPYCYIKSQFKLGRHEEALKFYLGLPKNKQVPTKGLEIALEYIKRETEFLRNILGDAHIDWRGNLSGEIINTSQGLDEYGERDRLVMSGYPWEKNARKAIGNIDLVSEIFNLETEDEVEKYRKIIYENC